MSEPLTSPAEKYEASRTSPLTEAISFASQDKTSTCQGILWLPAQPDANSNQSAIQAVAQANVQPRGIIQLVHGMVEHIACYNHVARELCARGFAVCGIDHIGHGKTQPVPELRGVYDPANGADHMIEDQHTLRQLMQKRWPNVPYALVGHSMGSFVTRCYLGRHGDGLAAAVIMGTGWQGGLSATRVLLGAIGRMRGWDYRSSFVDGLGAGGYNKAFVGTGANTGYEWLSTSPERPLAYAADPDCGWMFSVSGYYVISQLLSEAQSASSWREIPADLPILIISGAQDPVGANGVGPARVARNLQGVGLKQVEFELVDGARHELFNEAPELNVTCSVADWLEQHLSLTSV